MEIKKLNLVGTKKEKIMQILQGAGWYEARSIDIKEVMDYYQKYNIELHQAAIRFLKEYSGIYKYWYLTWEFAKDKSSDFMFEIYPNIYPNIYEAGNHYNILDDMYDDNAQTVRSDDYQRALDFSKEDLVVVGEIGYYYPAMIWIGESGTIYATHDYDDSVYKFETVFDLIAHELIMHDISDNVTICSR